MSPCDPPKAPAPPGDPEAPEAPKPWSQGSLFGAPSAPVVPDSVRDACEAAGVTILTDTDPRWPEALRGLRMPRVLLRRVRADASTREAQAPEEPRPRPEPHASGVPMSRRRARAPKPCRSCEGLAPWLALTLGFGARCSATCTTGKIWREMVAREASEERGAKP